jgi:outer membrane immunogenic protein
MERNLRRLICFALFGLVLMVARLVSNVALAADEKKAIANEEYNWTGFYVGVNFGYGLGDSSATAEAIPFSTPTFGEQKTKYRSNGVLGGMQSGYNIQRGILVFGAETDFSAADLSKKKSAGLVGSDGLPSTGHFTIVERTKWLGTLRLRVGVTPTPKLLLYGTGGGAYGNVNYNTNIDFVPLTIQEYPGTFNKWKVGWTAGAGAEYAIYEQLSLKLEYLYYDLGRTSHTADPLFSNPPWQMGYKIDTAAHILRFGINYRFN